MIPHEANPTTPTSLSSLSEGETTPTSHVNNNSTSPSQWQVCTTPSPSSPPSATTTTTAGNQDNSDVLMDTPVRDINSINADFSRYHSSREHSSRDYNSEGSRRTSNHINPQSTSQHRRRGEERARNSTSDRHRHYMNRTLLHREAPENFDRMTTPHGQVYFVNRLTGQSTWHDPALPRDTSELTNEDLGALPDGWEVRYTTTGRRYFVDHNTRTTQFAGKLSIILFIDNRV